MAKTPENVRRAVTRIADILSNISTYHHDDCEVTMSPELATEEDCSCGVYEAHKAFAIAKGLVMETFETEVDDPILIDMATERASMQAQLRAAEAHRDAYQANVVALTMVVNRLEAEVAQMKTPPVILELPHPNPNRSKP